MKSSSRAAWIRLSAVVLAAWLTACTPPMRPAAKERYQSVAATTGNAVSAPKIAATLQSRYDDTSAYCGSNLPSVLCSGLLLRATQRGNYSVWNPNPGSVLKKGVSFSWLRQDVGFSGLVFGYTNGFIVMPPNRSAGYTQLKVNCIYAFDADTYNRPGGANDGCAAHSTDASTNPCQAQDVFNANAWMTKFGNASNPYIRQCAFILREGTPDAGTVFHAIKDIRARKPTLFYLQNEVMVGTWAQNDNAFPLEAFFVVNSSPSGKSEARANQADFRNATGRLVPIVNITMPQSAGARAIIQDLP